MARLAVLSYVLPNGTAGAFALDASVNEQHVTTAQVTQHQVETGSPVNDFVRPMPLRFTIEGMVTNTPLVLPVIIRDGNAFKQSGAVQGTDTAQSTVLAAPPGRTAQALTWKAQQFQGGAFDRVKDFFEGVSGGALNGAVWGIYTTLRTYTKMVVVNFSVPRSAESGDAVKGTIDFQELRFADTVEVAAPVRGTQKRGQKSTTALDEKKPEDAKKQSFLDALISGPAG